MLVTVAVCSILLFSAQSHGNQLELDAQVNLKDHNEFLSKMKTGLSEISLKLKGDLEKSSSDLQELPSVLLKEGIAQLNLYNAESLDQIRSMSAPEQCINDGQIQLTQLHKKNLNNFFTCKNITSGVTDILKMGFVVLKVTAQILVTGDDILNGLGRCISWNPFKFVYCTFEWVKNTMNDISESFKAIANFNKEISVLAKDMKNQFDYCLHGNKKTAFQNHLIVINAINECSKQLQQ